MPYKDRASNLAYFRARYAAKREQLSAQKKLAYAANPAPAKARCRKYRAANTDSYLAQSRAYSAKYHATHRDKAIAYSARYRLTHLTEHAEFQSRRRALKRGTQVEKIDFIAILRDSKGMCGICKKPLDLFGIEFDHIVPLARGGTHTVSNIQPTHTRCNRAKGAKVS